tara:strand:+ start:187 stop:936 length:750 start_codon:yes stop_codon:yes gene_type:complete
MIHIFTSVVNRPDFVILQDTLFKKFLKNDYTFHIIDDSIDPQITEQFEIICSLRELKYYRKPPTNISMNPAQACAHTIQWSYDNLIKKNHSDDIVFFTDSDMFLIDEFDIEEYMSDGIIGGLPQGRGHVTYMWNGIMFFNMPKIEDKDIDFSDGIVEGQLTDVGGHTYYYFKKTGIVMKKSDVDYPTHYYDIDLQKDSNGYDMELHLNGNFLHYRAATNWHSNWKGSDDPLEEKTKVFGKIIQKILEEK